MLRTPRSSQYSGGVFSSVPVFPMQGDMKKIAFYPHWLLSLLWMTFLLETFKSWNSQLNLGRQGRGRRPGGGLTSACPHLGPHLPPQGKTPSSFNPRWLTIRRSKLNISFLT